MQRRDPLPMTTIIIRMENCFQNNFPKILMDTLNTWKNEYIRNCLPNGIAFYGYYFCKVLVQRMYIGTLRFALDKTSKNN